MKYTDLLLLDIKLIDDKAHRELTGCTNENILDLARYLDEIGKPVWIRHVLVPERSDYDKYLIRLDEFLHSLHNVQRVEVLPYHTLGVFKWETLESHTNSKASIRRPKSAWKTPINCCIRRNIRDI